MKKHNYAFILFFAVLGSLHFPRSAEASVPICRNVLQGLELQFVDYDLVRTQNPHSAFFIGQQIRLNNLKQTIREISGRNSIDTKGCLEGRCKARDKDRFRDYLSTRLQALGTSVYYEWERNDLLSTFKLNLNPDFGPLNLKTAKLEFLESVLGSRSLNTFFLILKRAGFDFSTKSIRAIDADFVEELISLFEKPNFKSQSPISDLLPVSMNALKDTSFFTNKTLNGRLLRELKTLKDRIYAGELAKNLARGTSQRLLDTPEVINVVAEIKGTKFPNEIIEVSAHYDTVPGAPGADDNGSGISTMLEMIRVFQRFSPERTLRFVFTDLEESGKYGSILHSQLVKARNDNLLAALVIDTIGYHPKRANNSKPVYVLELGTRKMHLNNRSYENTRKLAEAIAWQSNRYNRFVRYSVETRGALPGTGDHGSYLENGLPALFAAAGFEGDLVNPGYHKPTDTIKNYNWPYFFDIVKILTEGVALVAGSSLTPDQYVRLPTEMIDFMDSQKNPEFERLKTIRTIYGKGIPKSKEEEKEFDPSDPEIAAMLKFFGIK